MAQTERPPVDYDRYPLTLEGLAASVAAQLRREEELGPLLYEEMVQPSAQAWFELIEEVLSLRKQVSVLLEIASR